MRGESGGHKVSHGEVITVCEARRVWDWTESMTAGEQMLNRNHYMNTSRTSSTG